MKIKLAILEKNIAHLEKMASVLGTKYADKLEIYSFTNAEAALATLKTVKMDVLLASEGYDIDVKNLPGHCAFAYLVEFGGVDTINDRRAISKFQKTDLIYKQILSLYSENASSITGFTVGNDKGRTIAFCSASGGVGSSTMAAACAAHFAAQNKKVLYLNLEKFGSSDVFFEGAGQFDMSDIIFALKSKKTNLPLKLESCVKQDASGVYFYSQAKIALDMIELTTEEIINLISQLKLSGEYDYIILDLDFAIDKGMLKIYREAQGIVLVGDGSVESNVKTERAYKALATLEQNAEMPLTDRMSFVYDKVSSKDGVALNIPGLKVIGGAPRYVGANIQQVRTQLASLSIFEDIL